MSRIIFFVCSLLLLMVGQAAVAADVMPIWKGASTAEGFAEFRTRLKNIGGVYPNGDLSAEKLALGACSMAGQQKLNGHLAQCQTDFRRLNGLPAVSKFGEATDKVTYQQFATVRDDVGWRLPLSTVTPVVAAAPVAGDVALLRRRADAVAEAQKMLVEELAAVRRQLRGATQGRTATAGQIAELQKGEKELLAQIDAVQRGVDSKLGTLEANVAGMSGQLGNLSSTVEGLGGRFEAVQSRFDQNRSFIYGLLAAILLIIGLMVFGGFKERDINKRLAKTNVAVEGIEERLDAVEQRVEAVAVKENNSIRIAMGATETGQAALAKAEAAQTELKEVRVRANAAAVTADKASRLAGEAIEVAFNVQILTTIDESVLADLSIGDRLPVEIMLVDVEQKLTLMIERTTEGEVTIQGITRQKGSNTPVVTSLRREKIVSAIYRAARTGRVENSFPRAVKAA